jgi:flagellar basal-body rod protein FlgF
MDPISVLAASGIRSRMQSLDLLANNLANAGTNGYKADREFYSLFTSDDAASGDSGNTSTLPMVDKRWTDFSQGLLMNTANPLDLGLSGNGFFAVNGPSGPLYTRNGSFQISSSGVLVTSDGYAVRAQGGAPITVDPSAPLEVTSDGAVQQKGAVLGQLDIVSFADPATLVKQGSNYYRNSSPNATPASATNVEVHQGHIESSNVRTPDAAVQLVGVMRQFEILQKAITMTADMGKQAVQEVARIPS